MFSKYCFMKHFTKRKSIIITWALVTFHDEGSPWVRWVWKVHFRTHFSLPEILRPSYHILLPTHYCRNSAWWDSSHCECSQLWLPQETWSVSQNSFQCAVRKQPHKEAQGSLWLASGMAVTRTVPHSPPPPTRAQGIMGQKGQTDCKSWGWRGEPWDAGIWTWHAGGTNDLAASVVTCTRLVQGQVCQKFLHGAAKAHSCPAPSRGAIGSWSHFS